MPGGMRPGPRYNRLWRECDMTTADGVVQITTGIGAVVAAIAGRCNADKYTVLAGVVAEIGRNLTAHLNAPGLH